MAERRGDLSAAAARTEAEQMEVLVELCDCPHGADHAWLLHDSQGRPLRRGDHLVRGTLGTRHTHHGIFYGGASGQEVAHYARRDGTPAGDAAGQVAHDAAGSAVGGGPTNSACAVHSNGSAVGGGLTNRAGGGACAVHSNGGSPGVQGGVAFSGSPGVQGGTASGGSSAPVRPSNLSSWLAPVELRLDSLESFARGRPVAVLDSPHTGTADLVLARARARLGARGHDIFHLRCEGFATACRVGRAAEPNLLRETLASKVSPAGYQAGLGVGGYAAQRIPAASASPLSVDSQSIRLKGGVNGGLKGAAVDASASPRPTCRVCQPLRLALGPSPAAAHAAAAHAAGGWGGGGYGGSGVAAQHATTAHAATDDAGRARLLRLLGARSLVFAPAASVASGLPLLLGFLHGGGYEGAGYAAVRATAQRQLAAALQDAQPDSAAASYTAASERAWPSPVLVPWSRRLSKKAGDLLQLLLVLFDWQNDEPYTAAIPSGYSSFHGAGDGATFRRDLRAALHAFAQGMLFDAPPAPLAVRLLARRGA